MQIHSNEEEERGRGARKGSKRRYKDSPESQRTPSISWYVQIKVLYRDRTEMLTWRKGQKRQLTNEAFSWMGDNFCQIRQQKKKNRNKHANILVTDQFYWRKSRTETERGSGVRGQKVSGPLWGQHIWDGGGQTLGTIRKPALTWASKESCDLSCYSCNISDTFDTKLLSVFCPKVVISWVYGISCCFIPDQHVRRTFSLRENVTVN